MRYVGTSPVLKSREITNMFSKPSRMSGNACILLYTPCRQRKVGFSVKRHCVPNNARRNYLKRLLRESYRKHESLFPADKCLFFIALRETTIGDIEGDMVSMAGRMNR